MRLYRYVTDYVPSRQGLSLAIGNFDGCHRGHQAVLGEVARLAALHQLIPAVMCFEPQSNEFFGKPIPRLYSLRDKLHAFAAFGIEVVLCLHFDRIFAALEPERFISEILHERLNVRCVRVGEDFCFGARGSGTPALLGALGAPLGIDAAAVPDLPCLGGERISSTRVRAHLAQGDVEGAQELLGHPYAIRGRVAHGQALGRTLGFPTINLRLNRRLPPCTGSFVVHVRTPLGDYDGVADLGYRPSVLSGRHLALEAHLFDFSGTLYGREVEVTLLHKLRDEEHFPDLETLKEHIGCDIAAARAWLGSRNLSSQSSRK